MNVLGDPFFWASVSMLGLIGAEEVVGRDRLAKARSLGVFIVWLFGLGRVVLVLPAVSQPRFAADWAWVVRGMLFAAGVVFTLPVCVIRAFTAPEAGVSLKESGFYRLLRNPIYFAEKCCGASVGR